MKHLDDELKSAFQRQSPSPDFVARVLESLPEEPPAARTEPQAEIVPIRSRRPLAYLAVAAAVAALVFGSLAAFWPTAPQLPDDQMATDSQPAGVRDDLPAPEPDSPPAPPEPEPRNGRDPSINPGGPGYSIARRDSKRHAPRPRRAPRRTAREPVEQVADASTARSEEAAEQLVLALRFTSGKLSTVRRSVVNDDGSR